MRPDTSRASRRPANAAVQAAVPEDDTEEQEPERWDGLS